MIVTKCWKIENNEQTNERAINEAAALLKAGKTVAFPTETVYGLGADALNAKAVSKIFKAKQRPEDNPLIAHVATKEQLEQLVNKLPDYAEKMIDELTPGPITFVLPSNGTCAENVTAGLSSVAVRIPSHPVAKQLLAACNRPIAAPSANISGRPSPTTANHVFEDLQGKISGLVDGGATGVGMESTVVDCTGPVPIILRPGGTTKEQIEAVINSEVLEADALKNEQAPISPGLKYKHYTPEVPLWIVKGSQQYVQSIINNEQNEGRTVAVFAHSDHIDDYQADEFVALGKNMTEIATHLYQSLRKFKKAEIDIIICEAFPEQGIGQAIMNRLHKAASNYLQER